MKKKLKIGDKITLDNKEVTVVNITKHPEVQNSVYYEFSDGSCCKDGYMHTLNPTEMIPLSDALTELSKVEKEREDYHCSTIMFKGDYEAAVQGVKNGFKPLPENDKTHYLAECFNCGWWGSSEFLHGGGQIGDTGDYSDTSCPICHEIDNVGDREEKDTIQSLQSRVAQLESAMKTFVDRVEKGETRSRKTYAQFKELLNPQT